MGKLLTDTAKMFDPGEDPDDTDADTATADTVKMFDHGEDPDDKDADTATSNTATMFDHGEDPGSSPWSNIFALLATGSEQPLYVVWMDMCVLRSGICMDEEETGQ
jgi:hypothetical protein